MHCGGKLGQSDWLRAGFGLPAGTSDEVLVRHSFVCGSCKRRTTPSSLRWMYYRWFSSPSQFLVPALRGRLSRSKMIELCTSLGISPSRLRIWKRWWRDEFLSSPYWKLCGIHRFQGVVCAAEDFLLDACVASEPTKNILTDLLGFFSGYRTTRLWRLWPQSIERLWGLS